MRVLLYIGYCTLYVGDVLILLLYFLCIALFFVLYVCLLCSAASAYA